MRELNRFQHTLAAMISQPVAGAMAIYRNTALSGAVEALRANYPVVAAVIGDQMFEAMAVDFAHDHPPASPVLAAYGIGMADWIEEQGWSVDLPYLSDLARYERLFTEALFAADARPLDMAMIDEIAPEDWNLYPIKLHPASRFGWSTTPAMTLWLAHQSSPAGEMELEWKAQGGLFTRPGHGVQPLLLDPPMHRFLFGIRLGETVGRAATATAATYVGCNIGRIFTTLVHAGVFAAPEHLKG
jgi:hypothetical protein